MSYNRLRALSLAAVSAFGLMGLPLAAQAGAQPVSFEASHLQFNIPAQSLASALTEFSRQSQIAILVPNDVVNGRQSVSISGEMTPRQALSQIIAGSGLRIQQTPNGGLTLARDKTLPPPRLDAANQAASSEQGVSNDLVIVVTAQKRRENINDVGMSITALSGDQLVNAGIKSPEDLAKAVPGLTYSHIPTGAPVFTLRGIGFFDQVAASSPGVSTYLDEVPLPYALMTRGASLDVQHVEVLKGPQGTLFGQNVTGGAINFIANRPTREFAVGLDASYSSYDEVTANGFVSGPLSDSVRARLALSVDNGGDWQKSFTREDTRGATRAYVGRLLVDWDPSDDLKLQFNVNGWIDKSDTQAGQLVALATPPFIAAPALLAAVARYPQLPPNARYADWTPGPPLGNNDPIGHEQHDGFSRDNNFVQLSVRADYQLSSAATLTSITSWDRLKENELGDSDGMDINNWNSGSGADITSFSQELRLAGHAHRVQWLVGANFADDHIDNYASGFSDIGSFPFKSAGAIGKTSIRTYAAFAHMEYALTDALDLIAGIRYTAVRIHNEGCSVDGGDGQFTALVTGLAASRGVTIFVPTGGCLSLDAHTFQPGIVVGNLNEHNVPFNVGLNWKVTRNALLYASVSRGYKAGSYTLLSSILAPALDPATQESVLAYEAGFKLGLAGNRLQLNGAAFYYDYSDKQTRGRAEDPIVGVLNKLINIPKSRITGGEIQLAWVPDEHWRVNLGVTYTGSEILGNFTNITALGAERNMDGQVLPFTPKLQLVGDVEYAFPIAAELGAFIGAHVQHQSESFAGLGEEDLVKIDGYTNLDLRLGVRSEAQRWSVTAFVNNATDEYSWSVTGLAGPEVFARFANPPRIFGIRLSVRN